ncbi:MAG: WG repeat-containing protein [Bacteroidia bacterium]
MSKFLVCIFLICAFFTSRAASIDKGYAALHEYDYFKAKKLFYAQLKKSRAEASFGLATIYYRNDNPFYNLDSAYKYISVCRNSFSSKKSSRFVNDTNLIALHDSICDKAYNVFLQHINIQSAEKYATTFYQSKYVNDVLCKRDSLAFNEVKNSAQSAIILTYINLYPQSCYLQKAQQLLHYNVYQEITALKNDSSYLKYIKQFPKTKYTQQAKEELLAYYIQAKNAAGIYYYIKNINATYFAWNALFSAEIKNYTEKDLQLFLKKYPDYPDKKQVEEEFSFWQMPFFSIKNEGKYGFIDSTGKICIEPIYNEVEDFKEGFALVQKNNLYGYINKAGRVKIDFQFDEASSFLQQVAIVQQNKTTFLIDHAGKKISANYDEIADFTDNVAIVKKNNLYGAINHSGEELIKPSFSYLSDFSENFASFLQNNKYGFINNQGFIVVAPIYNWVSAFKNNQCRVKIDNHLGVINKHGDFVIQPLYDFIDEPFKGIYVVVKNNLYGFVDTSSCFLSEIKYSYNPALKIADLTNGIFMRLIENNKEELQDKNGIKYFTQQNFTQIQLCESDIIAAHKKNKIQFYNVNKTTPTKAIYNEVDVDANYWYANNDKGCSIFTLNLKDKLFTIKADKIKQLNTNYFRYTNDDGMGIVTKNRTIVLEAYFDEVTATQMPHIFYIERKEKGAYFNVNTLQFIWKENGFNPAYIADEE